MRYKLKQTLTGAVIIGLMIGLAMALLEARFQGQAKNTHSNSDTTITQFSVYGQLAREAMIDQADIIFVGKVVKISPTQWNQDSGEVWEDGPSDKAVPDDNTPIQLHYIELDIIQPIVATTGLERQITITGLGPSPLDGYADHDLKEGDQAVFFVRKTELAWRDGTRPILELMGVPTDAYFRLGADGLYHGRPVEQPISLEDLIKQIAQRRTTLVQP